MPLNEVLMDQSQSLEFFVESAIDLVNHVVSKKVESVTSAELTKDGWTIVVEVLERKVIPDSQDLLSRYQIRFSADGKLLGWKQILVRKRIEHYSE